MRHTRNKRPLSPYELEERKRTVPLSYIADEWDKDWQNYYSITRLILNTTTALQKHFPDKSTVTKQHFIQTLSQYTGGRHNPEANKVLDYVWFQAWAKYDDDIKTRKRELERMKGEGKKVKVVMEPDLSIGVSPRNH